MPLDNKDLGGKRFHSDQKKPAAPKLTGVIFDPMKADYQRHQLSERNMYAPKPAAPTPE